MGRDAGAEINKCGCNSAVTVSLIQYAGAASRVSTYACLSPQSLNKMSFTSILLMTS
jgi:hypothetical protein